MMQSISVAYAIDSRINGEDEEKDISNVAGPRGDARDHFAAGQGLDEDEIGHY